MTITPKKYFMIVNGLLITAGVYFGVSAFYTIGTAWLSPGEKPQAYSRKVALQQQEDHPPLSRYRAITKRNLFNTNPDIEAPARAIDVDNLEKTDLNLKLWGTVTGQARRAYAVIEDTKTRKQELYRIGDSIQDATVKLILRQKVVLSVSDRDEILGMEEIGAAKRGRESPRIARKAAGAPPKMPVSSYPRQLTLKSDQIESALENLDQLMDQARIRPHIEEGRPAGISITGIKPNTIFRKMRLRNGDIITGVNGEPIESVEDAMKIFSDLRSAPEVQVEIKR
ncbi:MAG: PDZ domain-containing protein, partial [Desulfobacterales bacterium]|nr:PDZ domain-containing protein [Desulfobacterales bacterium]